jgi:hypothetical protein
MRFTTGQAEAGMSTAIVFFSLAVGLGAFVECNIVGASTAYFGSNPLAALGPVLIEALFAGILATIVAGLGAILVTLVVGIGLTALASLALRRTNRWQLHCVTFAILGVLAALAVAALWFGTSQLSWHDAFGSWLVDLDVVLIIAFAGGSTALAWHRTWRRSLLAPSPWDSTEHARSR